MGGEGFDLEYWKVFARAKGPTLNVPGTASVVVNPARRILVWKSIDRRSCRVNNGACKRKKGADTWKLASCGPE